jgi:hypothetical protein
MTNRAAIRRDSALRKDGSVARFYIMFSTAAKPGRGEEYSEWCRTQHFPDIMRVPGLVSAKRFKVLDAGDQERFAAIFEVECDDPRDVMREIGRRNGTPEMPSGDCFDPASVTISFAELEGEWHAAV